MAADNLLMALYFAVVVALPDKWPKDEAAWRQLPHHPIAEVELILFEARAALKWMKITQARENLGANA